MREVEREGVEERERQAEREGERDREREKEREREGGAGNIGNLDLGNAFTVCNSKNDFNVQVTLFQRGYFRVGMLMPTPSYPLFFFIPIIT